MNKEVLEGNKRIAEFMELMSMEWGGLYSISQGQCTCRENTPEKALNGFASIAKYHESWDWLMPAIGKISSNCEEPEELDGLKYALLCDDIKTAWKFLVDYLKF